LVPVYTRRFKNFRDTIGGSGLVTLVYCTRWKRSPVDSFYYCLEMLQRYNPKIRMVVINGIDNTVILEQKYESCLYKEYLEFPEVYHTTEWPLEKVKYDQEVFRVGIAKPLGKYI
jgi:hypothetical protein